MARITIVDTTLREGARAPGTTLTASEQLRVAQELAALGVDVLEVGSLARADVGPQAQRSIATAVRDVVVSVSVPSEAMAVDRAAELLESAARPRINVVSTIQGDATPRRSEEVDEAVRRARHLCDDVAVTILDAWSVHADAVIEATIRALDAGAGTITLSDRTGGALPGEIGDLVGRVIGAVPSLPLYGLGVSCRNDLGLGVAGSLAAVSAGARQVECALGGLGPRAGGAALEEVVALLTARAEVIGHETGVRLDRLFRSARLLAYLTGIEHAPHKAIVGRDAFADAAGDLDGSSDRRAPIVAPPMVGAPDPELLGHGRPGLEGLEDRYRALGYTLTPEELNRVGEAYQALASRKLEVLDEDLISILHHGVMEDVPEHFRLADLDVRCGGERSRATVEIVEDDEMPRTGEGAGDGPIAATFAALDAVLDFRVRLEDLTIRSATPGGDALGEVTIHASIDGQTFTGRGAHTDVVKASANAFLHAVNKAAAARVLEERHITATSDWGV